MTLAGVTTPYTLPTPDAEATAITTGPDGNLWATESQGNAIARITPTGTATEFPLPTAGSAPAEHRRRARRAAVVHRERGRADRPHEAACRRDLRDHAGQRRAAARDRRRRRRQPLGRPVGHERHRAGDTGGHRHLLPRPDRLGQPVRCRRRPRRQRLVHRAHRRPDRADHAERDDHRVPAAIGLERADDDRRGTRRRALVRRDDRQRGRADHGGGRHRGVPADRAPARSPA